MPEIKNPPTTAPAASATQTTPAAFWWVTAGFALLALVPTIWTPLDLMAASIFSAPIPASNTFRAVDWFWVKEINDNLPTYFRWFLLACFVAWALSFSVFFSRFIPKTWRFALIFIVITGAIGPGAVVNYGFKDQWLRARPYQVQEFGGEKQFTRAGVLTDQCSENCSFVSGHVSCGIFLATIMLIHRRRRIAWGVAGSVAALAVGFCRMADSAHWLSDVLWACPITLISSWIVWKLMLRWLKPAINFEA